MTPDTRDAPFSRLAHLEGRGVGARRYVARVASPARDGTVARPSTHSRGGGGAVGVAFTAPMRILPAVYAVGTGWSTARKADNSRMSDGQATDRGDLDLKRRTPFQGASH